MQSKVLVINGDSYYTPFSRFGAIETNPRILDYKPETVKLAVFTGGSDVHPSLYKEQKSKRTSACFQRDQEEEELFLRIKKLKIPCFGICRGIQFLCVMAGGKLVQHLDNHAIGRSHVMLTSTGKNINVNSLHHQMALPGKIPHILLGWAEPKLSKSYIGGMDQEIESPYEYEAIYFPEIDSVGVQYHPEMMSNKSDGFTYAVDLAEQLIEQGFDKL